MNRLKKLEEKKYYFTFLSLIIPLIIFTIIYIISGFHPLGKYQILIIDAYHQYFQFMIELRGKIMGGESLLYSWHMGLGTDFLSLMAYYAMSPLYILTIFVPESLLNIFFAFLISIKVSIGSLSFSIYLKSIYNRIDYSVVIFSLFYAFCGFIAGYYWNIMWLDVFAIFPLIILGLKKIIEENKFGLYFIFLSLSFFTNYYMSIFISIFIVIYYITYSINIRIKFIEFIKKGIFILIISILAAGVVAWLLIPAAIALSNIYKTSSLFTGEIKLYNNFRDLLGNFLAFNYPTVREGLPNIYSGLLSIFLALVYFYSKGIKLKEKILTFVVLLFLILSTNINILDYFWNGLRYTNMLPYRFSFLVSFVLVTIAYKGYKNLKEIDSKEYIFISLIAIGIVILLGIQREIVQLIGNLVLIIIYFIIIYLNKIKYSKILSASLYLIIIVEVFANTYIGLSTGGSTTYSIFNENRKDIVSMVKEIEKEKGKSFYRLEVLDRFTFNDPALYQYNGVSLFSSTTDGRVSTFLETIGVPSYPLGNRYFYSYNSPLVNGILNIDYILSKNTKLQENYGFELSKQFNSIYVYKNNKSLPLGFMVNKDANNEMYYSNLIENQNKLFNLLTNTNEDFLEIVEKNSINSINLKIDEISNNRFNYTIINDNESAKINIKYIISKTGYYYLESDKVEESTIELSNKNNKINLDMDRKNIVSVGYYQEGDNLQFSIPVDNRDDGNYYFNLAILDETIFDKGYKVLEEQSAKKVKYSSRKVEMEIDVDKDGYFFTSIPYNEGWKMYINGEEHEIVPFNEAFVGANLKEGNYKIEFKYISPGFKLGLGISAGSIIIVLIFVKRKRMLKGYEN